MSYRIMPKDDTLLVTYEDFARARKMRGEYVRANLDGTVAVRDM